MLQEDAGRAPGSSAAKFRGGGEDQRREGKARWFLAEFLAQHFYTLGLLGQIHKVVGHVQSMTVSQNTKHRNGVCEHARKVFLFSSHRFLIILYGYNIYIHVYVCICTTNDAPITL